MADQGSVGSTLDACGLVLELSCMQEELENQSRINANLASRLAALCSKVETPSTPADASDAKDGDMIRHCLDAMVLPAMQEVPRVPRLNHKANMNAFASQQSRHSTKMGTFTNESSSPRSPACDIFDGTSRLRIMIRKNLKDEKYNVTNFYKSEGVFQAIARSNYFEAASLALVIISSMWMAVDIDYNKSYLLHQADTVFQVVGHIICFLFTAELLIRFLAFKNPRNIVRDYWCMFDLFLVTFIVTEAWFLWVLILVSQVELTDNNIRALGVLRMMRLVRILRLVKVFRFVPELFVIIRGIGIAVRAISLVFVLLGILLYVGAIAFRVLLEATSLGKLRFKTVTQAMGTLLVDCALSGTKGGPLMREAYDEHPIFSLLFFCYAMLANVTMMGVLAGLLVQTIKKIAEVEEDEKRFIKNLKTMDEFWNHIKCMDEDHDGFITHDEFVNLLSDRKTLKLLRKMDVDPEILISLSDFMFVEHDGRINQIDFNKWVLDLRSTQKGTLKDHYVTRRFIAEKLSHVFDDAYRLPKLHEQFHIPDHESGFDGSVGHRPSTPGAYR